MAKQRFLVTGGSQGIGAALVSLARKEGHDVVFTGRDRARIDRVAAECGAHGLRADVARPADNQRTVEACVERMGGIDVLVNNAGVGYLAEIGAIDMSRMRALFDINVFGLVDLTNRVAPMLTAQQRGYIFNIASTSGMKGGKAGTVYAASKWALRGISQSWQTELRPHGVHVTCVCPSEVQTDWMGRTGRNNPNKLYAADIAEAIMAALRMHPRALWPEFAIFANNPWKED
ncbi:MAG: SDR family NAD(P)-dependent oxidoreductase [Acidobacteria bacterium]|nr:SDR family NAD(P)-dependent oxidoreductase [Acidobacteriota bacterium]